MGVEIRLAGLLTVRGEDGVERHLASAQARVALVRLTLERDRGTTRDELADAVWPGTLPSTWGSALRTLISRVRAFVALALPCGVDPLVSQGGRYRLCLADDVVVDVEEAQRAVASAQQAMAQRDPAEARRWAAEGLVHLRAPLLPEHEGPWVSGVRERLTELLVSACETASDACVVLGDTAQALAFANEALLHAPLRESAHRCRMTAQAAAGNRAEALRTYQRLRRVLAEELGVDPAPETEAAYLELLGPAAPTTGAPSRPAARRAALPPFVGRGRELSQLAAAWREAAGGIRQLLAVSGEAGIGKTRLAMEAGRAVAAEGGLVLFGRADRDAVTSYQPFVEALDAYVAAAPVEELPRLSDAGRRAVAAVLPSFPGHGAPPANLDRTTLFDALTKLLVGAVRERPALVVLDDLQWADRGTSLLLRHVLRRTRGTRLLVVAVSRDDLRGPHPLSDVVRALDCDGWLHRLRLSGLGDGEVASLVQHVVRAQRSGSGETAPPGQVEGLARRLREETAGNPLIMLELLRWFDPAGPTVSDVGSGTLPPGVHDLLVDKLTALGPGPMALLRAAAVAGNPFELDVVQEAVGLDTVDALDALDVVLAAGLVVDVGRGPDDGDPAGAGSGDGSAAGRDRPAAAPDGAYRFVHRVVQRALLAQMSTARRRFLVGRLAGNVQPVPRPASPSVISPASFAARGVPPPRISPASPSSSLLASDEADSPK